MNTESPRLRALLAAGAALVVFGVTNAATAAPDGTPGQPGVGEVGQAQYKARPPGQSDNDKNRGFTCDENKGAGLGGNPALPHDCYGQGEQDPTPPKDNNGGGKGDGVYVPPTA